MKKYKTSKSKFKNKIKSMKDEVTIIHEENPYERAMKLVAKNSRYGVLMGKDKKRRD